MLRKASNQTTESNTDNRPCSCLTFKNQVTSSYVVDCKRDTGDKMAGSAGDSRAEGAGLVTSPVGAPPPDSREVMAWLGAPALVRAGVV